MQEPTDDQLDGLFRKSAEEFHTPFDPAAWQALKNRLDDHDRLTIWEHLLRWGLPVLLMVFLTAGSWNSHRLQVKTGQMPITGGSALAAPARQDQRRPQRAPENQSQMNETAVDLVKPSEKASGLKSGIGLEPAGIEPVGNEQRISSARASDAKTNTDEVASATGKADRPATAGATDIAASYRKPTDRSGSDVSPSAIAPVSVAETDGTRRNALATTKRAVSRPTNAAERTERVRAIITPEERSRSLSGRRTTDRMAATFSANGQPLRTRSSTERRRTPDKVGKRTMNESAGSGRVVTLLTETGTEPVMITASQQPGTLSTAVATEPAIHLSFHELINRPGNWPASIAFASRDVVAPLTPLAAATETNEKPASQPAVSQKGLSVRFVVSPDLSAVGLRDFQRPGTNVGLLLEYRLASRWSVQTGLIQSTKVYKALASQYKLDSYALKMKVLPESVSGHCNMFDIPVNLRYDVAIRPRQNGQIPSRWFVSAGFTTYVMKQEDYTYNYPEGTHIYPSTPKQWSGKTGAYGFSQVNLSAGYERTLSRRLSWQVEPFIKMPLKGVGYFKIDLLSTGVFFSLRYKL